MIDDPKHALSLDDLSRHETVVAMVAEQDALCADNEALRAALRRLKNEVDFIEPRNPHLEAAFVGACGALGEPVPEQGAE